ncbi:MAG: hypothetical protein ABWY36_06310 [Leifsonia sp.]
MEWLLWVWVVVVAAGIGLGLSWWIIKSAVLAALREHVKTSTTGVQIVRANPLRVVVTTDEQVDGPQR